MASLEAFADELAHALMADLLGPDLFPHLDRRIRRVAGAKRRVEFLQRIARVVDKLDLHLGPAIVGRGHRSVILTLIPPSPLLSLFPFSLSHFFPGGGQTKPPPRAVINSVNR